MIEIKPLDALGLLTYIESDDFLSSPVIAISKHRAISHLQNPRARETDILLLMAYEGHQMVGYLGVLPDDIKTDEGETIHFGWMSCLWIDPDHRGKKIAQKLIEACFQSWDNKILLTEYTEAAGALYQKMGIFSFFHRSEGLRWYVHSDLQTILPPKKPIFKTLAPLLKLIDGFFNIIIQGRHLITSKKLVGYQITVVSAIDKETKEFVQKQLERERFARTAHELNWILTYPWIIQSDLPAEELQKYHFTSFEKVFDCKGIEIRSDDHELVAFLIFTNRNGHLRIPYLYHGGNMEAIRLVCRYLLFHLQIKTCTIYHQELITYLKINPLIKMPSKTVRRNYLVSKTWIDKGWNEHLTIQDGDGDCAFT
jgi:GNAT superfamily N-acetyltransferase